MRFRIALLVPLLGAALSAFAQPPHTGTWAIDYTRSDPGEVVFGFDDLGAGLWQFSMGGRRILQFRMDKSPCSTCVASEPWKPIGPNTWHTGWRALSGVNDIVKVAADGASLSLISEGVARTFERLAGGPGLAGQWRTKLERSGSPPVIELSPAVDEWFVFKSPAEGLICVVLLDGADHPCSAALLPPGSTTRAIKITDTGNLAVVVTQNGQRVSESTYTVSADGRSMTQTERPASGASVTTVYTRQ